MSTTACDRLQLSLVVVRKSKVPRAIIVLQKLRMVYDYQPKAWMAGDIFSHCPVSMMRYLFFTLKYADGDDLVKNPNLKHCCYMIAQAWNSISASTLRTSWN
ncbi:hypothetical protein T4D_3380 [Trichinella pseudospiralis]|uniref:DDE-1 domain-containing protein n=1 Tax=Trichinella pseudospiralis TaxID=6337 RepID=A0A0V1F932_TRIPS|nr:hypothetical protein T4D_3380 [Trichinella pseudospiralis]